MTALNEKFFQAGKNAPERVFLASTEKNTDIPIHLGYEQTSQVTGRKVKVGKAILEIDRQGLCKTRNLAVINAILNEPKVRKYFLDEDGELNEVYASEEHKKAVEEAISNGYYEYVDLSIVEQKAAEEAFKKQMLAVKEMELDNKAKQKEISEKQAKARKAKKAKAKKTEEKTEEVPSEN